MTNDIEKNNVRHGMTIFWNLPTLSQPGRLATAARVIHYR